MKLHLLSVAAGLLDGEHVSVAWFKQTCVPKITGFDIRQPEERQS